MGEARGIKVVRRGEIYLVSCDPRHGAETQKTRPALVVQNDIANRYSPITSVAAITSTINTRPRPTKVLVKAAEGGLSGDSMVLLNQIRSVDKRRLLKRLGKLRPVTLEDVNRALLISFGLVPV